MAQLPIRRLTLYKQGIGYFVRQGTIDEQIVTLMIPRSATNDVLKSLAVQVQGDGHVLSVDYETPSGDPSADMSVKLAARSSLVDLLTSLRGTVISLQMIDIEVSGRIIGVETSIGDKSEEKLLLQASDGEQIAVYDLQSVTGFTLHDVKAQRDVGFFLDTSQTETTRMMLTVRLSVEVQSLEISYLAPSPIWRVSYRLLGTGNGHARLLGWGLFDNSLGEDLDEVDLTLMSGRPISFEYKLNQSKIPPRPEIADDSTSLQAIANDPRITSSIRTISHDFRAPISTINGAAEMLKIEGLTADQQHILDIIIQSSQSANRLLDNLLSYVQVRDEHSEYAQPYTYSAGPLGDLKVSSSYFVPLMMGDANADFMVYKIETPVSVKRGQSAMVPIIDAEIEIEPLLVYNGDKMPNHPLFVWRFVNSTGVALEQGPVTIAENQYLGDGLLRFTGVGDEIQIPYALEFGILIEESPKLGDETLHGVEFDTEKRKIQVQWMEIREIEYSLISRVDEDRRVLIERRNPRSADFDNMPDPVMEADNHTRWAVDVPAKQTATFSVFTRKINTRAYDVSAGKLKADLIDDLHEAEILSDALYEQFQQLFSQHEQATSAREQIATLQTEYQQVVSRQEQLRQNIKTLGTSERETRIRNRILDDLETSENRRREIETTIADLETQIQTHEDEQSRIIAHIFEAV